MPVPGRLLLFPALTLLAAAPAAAQRASPRTSYAFRTWTTAQGLPQNTVTGLAQDRDGYLWVGTMGEVARFDGRTFVRVELPDTARRGIDPVRAVIRDRQGAVWVLRNHGGAERLSADGRLLPGISPLPDWPVTMAFGGEDSTWLVGATRLWLHTEGRWREPALFRGAPVGDVQAMVVDTAGDVWVGGSGGLARLTPRGVRVWGRADGLPSQRVLALAEAPGRGMWVGTDRGLVLLSPGGTVQRVRADSAEHAPVEAIAVDARGRTWLAGAGGVRLVQVSEGQRHEPRATTVFAHETGLGGARIPLLFVDDAERVWIGSAGAGLHQVRPLAITSIRRRDGLPMQGVHEVMGDGRGGLWIAGSCGGLVRWTPESLQVHVPPALGLVTACVEGLARDRRGGLWVGETGRFMHRDSLGRVRRYDLGLHDRMHPTVGPFTEDSAGNMWFATRDGQLGRVAPGGALTFPLRVRGLDSARVWSFADDGAGAVWVGQVGAVSRVVNDSVLLRLDGGHGVPPAPIRALLPDGAGALWIGSYGGGLAHYDPRAGVRRLTTADGLFDDGLSALIRDRAGNMWLLGDAGLAVVPQSELAAAMTERHSPRNAIVFGPADSMPEGNGGFPNAWLDADQRLWVATVDGVATVDAALFPFDAAPARPRIDRVLMNGKSVQGDTVTLPPGGAALEIRFSAPNLDGTDRLAFRHRLAGHDRDWIVGADRVARYARIAPGWYTFEVLARTAAGVEHRHPTTLAVRARAAWWELPLVRGLGILVMLWAVWQWQQRIVRRIRDGNRVLQEEVGERKRAQLEAARAASELAHVSRLATAGELATSIAHEINQPLSAIMTNAQAAKQAMRIGADEELEPVLDEIVLQSERAAGVVRSLRAFVRKQAPEARRFETGALIRDAARLVQPELLQRGVSIRVETSPDVAQLWGDPIQLQQVLVNLLLNAAEAVQDLPAERRAVTVRTERPERGGADLVVEDQGHGIGADDLVRVLEPFYTTKTDGLGLGLSLSRSIIESHAGTLTVGSALGYGTVVRVHLPEGGA
jgi:signal transduction histidine kinase/ligand-binding sensor domain-containing protein